MSPPLPVQHGSPLAPVPSRHTRALRTVALFEAAKGLIVLLAGSGLLLFMNRDLQAVAERLVSHLHLDPASHYPRIFLRLASAASVPSRIRLIALGAALYALFRFAEAFGLWKERRWAEWLAVATGSVYIPFEIYALIHRPGIEPLVFLVANLLIVGYLGLQLRARPAPANT